MILNCYTNTGFFTELGNELFISLVGALLLFVMIMGKDRFFNQWRLKKFQGLYKGYSHETGHEHDNKTFVFRYNFVRNRVVLRQDSTTKGTWTASIMIESSNPYVLLGRYDYEVKGSYAGDWGTICLWLNSEKTEIVVESVPKNRAGKGEITNILKREQA